MTTFNNWACSALAASVLLFLVPGYSRGSIPTTSTTKPTTVKGTDSFSKPEYLLSILTISVAAFVALVELRQYRINKERLKLDLFEKRFSVYKGIQIFLTEILIEAKFETNQLFKFRASTQDAVFLFREDITQYIQSVDKKALDFMRLSNMMEGLPVGKERSTVCEQESLLLTWLTDQLPRLKEVFSPY